MIDVARHAVVPPHQCAVCGGQSLVRTHVLWEELIAEWGISAAEAAYIDAQQGTHCETCGSNLRSMALAVALMRWRGTDGRLVDFVQSPAHANLRLLEINDAGSLHPLLQLLPQHCYGAYPDVDMRQLPYGDAAFDVVVHSDTLEHVPDPSLGLRECRRVVAAGGAVVFTVPTVIGRLSRSRAGLPDSFHGAPHAREPGMLVHSEFGADVWALVLAAGFQSCELVPCGFPAGLAIIARL